MKVYNARTNRLVDTIKTDKNGLAVSKPLPLARYKIVESKAAEFYGLDKTPMALESFYWRDTLPVKAVRLEKIYTGIDQ